jgi:hypothetical protein
MRHHEFFFPGSPEQARQALNAAAAAWGAGWTDEPEGAELVLPTVASLRRGVLRARVEIGAAPEGSRIVLREIESATRLNRGAVAVLIIGAASGVLLALWPFFPRLLMAAPLAAVLAFLAWFLVVSRLRMSGPEEFLGEVLAAARR